MGAPVAAVQQISVDRGQSPWQGYTSSAEEEARGRSIAAVALLPKMERPAHLERFAVGGEALLAIDREGRRVVVNARYFSNLERVDGTRLGKGDRHILGKVVDAALRARGRELVTFLLSAELIQTYAHIGSKLNLTEEKDAPGSYVVRVTGTHVYFTNRRNEGSLDFEVRVDKQSGELSVVGR